MMVIPSSVRLLVISRCPAPMKSSPGGIPVFEDLGPRMTSEEVVASFSASRPLSGRSETERVFSVSEMVASSLAMAGRRLDRERLIHGTDLQHDIGAHRLVSLHHDAFLNDLVETLLLHHDVVGARTNE